MESKYFLMEISIKDNIVMDYFMEKDDTVGQTDQIFKVVSFKVIDKVMEFGNHLYKIQMFIMVIILKIKKKEKENMFGQTVAFIKEHFLTI